MKKSTFAILAILAVLTIFGLVFALVLDGLWHIPALVALSVPLLAVSSALLAARKSRARRLSDPPFTRDQAPDRREGLKGLGVCVRP
jgi:Flp pilus assembly protein TadB